MTHLPAWSDSSRASLPFIKSSPISQLRSPGVRFPMNDGNSLPVRAKPREHMTMELELPIGQEIARPLPTSRNPIHPLAARGILPIVGRSAVLVAIFVLTTVRVNAQGQDDVGQLKEGNLG